MKLQQANPEFGTQAKDQMVCQYGISPGWASGNQLEQVEARLSLLEEAIAACGAGVVISDATLPDKPIIYCNRAFEQITGYSPEEVLGKSCRFLQGAETDSNALAEIRTSLREGRDCQVILQNYRKDGTSFWNELTISPVRDSSGKLTHFIGIQNDITSRKQAQIDRDRFFTVSLDLLCVADFDGNIKQINPAWGKILGFMQTELLATPFIELIHPEDRESSVARFRQLTTGINVLCFENRLRCQDGSYKWFSWNAIPIPEEKLCYAAGRDITDSKQLEEARQIAEAALGASETKFQKLAANIPGVIYQFLLRTDGSMYFSYISSGCREIYELEPEEIQQNIQLIFDTISPEERGEFMELIAISAQTLQPWQWEGQCTTISGNIKWIQCASRPEKLATGDILWDGLIMDVTARKQAEEALRQSEEKLREKATELEAAIYQLQKTQTQLIQTEKMSSLGQMIAGIAHEINNPVSFIYGNLTPASEYLENLLHLIELYRQKYPNPDQVIKEEIEIIDLDFLVADLPKMLTSMRNGADRIRQIVLGLRNFSRLDEADMKPVDLHEGIDNALLILQHRMKQSNGQPKIEVIKEYGNLPLVECYAGQINQVFMNIIGNAIDALEEEDISSLTFNKRAIINHKPVPTIRISTSISADSDRAVIRIIDNGPGMTEEIKKRLYDPFFTTKIIGKGTGLGLAISYQIVVEKHGGILDCISAPGEGAEFLIEIPIFPNK